MGFKTSKHIWRGPHTVSTEHRSWQQGGVQRRSRSRNLRYFLRGRGLSLQVVSSHCQLKIGKVATQQQLVRGFNPSEKYESQLGLLFPIYMEK